MVSDSGHGARPKGCAHWMASGRGHGSSPKGLYTLDGFWQGTWSLLVQILFSIMGKVLKFRFPRLGWPTPPLK